MKQNIKGTFCKELTYNGLDCSFVMIDIGYGIDPMIYSKGESEIKVQIIITGQDIPKGYIFIEDSKGLQDRTELYQLVKINYRKVQK